MSPPVSDRRGALLRWVVGLVAITVFAVVIAQLEASRPASDPQRPVRGESSAEVSDPLTCVRRIAAPEDDADPAPAEAAPAGRVTSTELIECPDRFDGRTVTYTGEVIGDVLERDGGAWVLMNDDAYALEAGPIPAGGELQGYNSGVSVWLPDPLPELIEQPGDPGWRGDVLRIEGVVHRADPADGGGLTIRATDAELVAEAARIERPLHRTQAVVAAALAVIALGVVAWERRVSRTR